MCANATLRFSFCLALTKMFQLFEFVLPALSVLPVEMVALMLRYLDPESLLNTAIANKHFMSVCRGDPVLRERIRLQVKKEKKEALKSVLDAKMGITVIRVEPSSIFDSNTKKTTKVERVPSMIRKHQPEQQKVLEARPFKVLPEGERTNGGGKIRRTRKTRHDLYKSLRF